MSTFLQPEIIDCTAHPQSCSVCNRWPLEKQSDVGDIRANIGLAGLSNPLPKILSVNGWQTA